MRSYLKILIATVLIGIGCFAGARTVKAEPATAVSLTFEPGKGIKYTFTGNPQDGTETEKVTKITIKTDGGSKDIENPGQEGYLSGKDAPGEASKDGTEHTYSAEVYAGDSKLFDSSDSVTQKLYIPNVTPENGTSSVSGAEKGFSGEKYSCTITPLAGCTFTVWNPGSGTNPVRDDLEFGTAYTATCSKATATVTPSINPATSADTDITVAMSAMTSDFYTLLPKLTSETGEVAISDVTPVSPTIKGKLSFKKPSSGIIEIYASKTDPGINKNDDYNAAKAKLDAVNAVLHTSLPFSYQEAPKVPTYVVVYGPSAVKINTNTAEYSAKVLDQDRKEMSGTYTVTWEIANKIPSTITPSLNPKSSTTPVKLNSGANTGTIDIFASITTTGGTIKSDAYPVALRSDATPVITLSTKGFTYGFDVDLDPYTDCKMGAVSWQVDASSYSYVDGDNIINIAQQDIDSKITLIPSIGGIEYPECAVEDIPVYDTVSITDDEGGPKNSISFYLPQGVFTYTKSYNNLKKVTGCCIVLSDEDDKELYTSSKLTPTVVDKEYSEYKLSADQIEAVIEKAGDEGKLDKLGDKDSGSFDLYLSIIPYGTAESGSSAHNKLAGDEASYREVHYLKIKGDSHIKKIKKEGKNNYDMTDFTASTGKKIYGQEGYSAKVTVEAESGYSFSKWDDDNTDNARTYEFSKTYSASQLKALTKVGSSSSSSSSMKSGSGLMSGSGSDYDKVPKTGEGNTRLLIIMIAVISATIAGSILLSNLPVRSKSGADEGVDDKDVFHKKD